MDHAAAKRFAAEWEAAWNSHDLDRVLAHYAPEVEFRSQLAARLIEGSDGVIRGIDQLRAYWTEGLRRNPALHFKVTDVQLGLDTIVIAFHHETGQHATEILTFHHDRIIWGMGARSPHPS
ncbi:nuclear transport factor 2 family protein [Actinocorallia aurea]